jgi:hypothetical protein
MAQTSKGAMKALAHKSGIPLEAFLDSIEKGLKWCYQCKDFHPVGDFGKDSSRYDGLTARCFASRNARSKELYIPRPKPLHRPCYAPDGNRRSAYVRIYNRIQSGDIPHPNYLPCCDCGHIWKKSDKRHEYDHYAGYSKENALKVEAVCTKCHHKRGQERGTHIRKHGANGRFCG